MEKNIGGSDDMYSKPGKEGWIREVVYSKAIQNRVTSAYYLSPEDEEGRRKKMTTYKSVDAYIKDMGCSSTLLKQNFCFTRRLLGLGSEHEKTRIGTQVGAGRPSIFSSYFTHNFNSCPPSVTCNLCSKTFTYTNFSRHMTMTHLPDEICSKCNKDFPARIINKHRRTCSVTCSKVDLFLVSSTSDEEAFGRTEKATEASNEMLKEQANVIKGGGEKLEELTSAVPEAYYKWEEKRGVSAGFHEKLEKDALFVTGVNEKIQKETRLLNKAGERLDEEASCRTGASDTLKKEVIVKTGPIEWVEKETNFITEAREKLEKESSVITGASIKLKETVRIIIQSRRKKLDLQVN